MITYLIDSNIVLRYLIPEATALHKRAVQYFSDAQNKKAKLFIDDVTLAEIVWVLKSVYLKRSKEISELLTPIIEHNSVVLNNKDLILQSLRFFSSRNLSYIDCYLRCLSESKGIPLATFDDKLSKMK